MSPTRRVFLGQLGSIALLPRLLPDQPELILHRGNVLTMDVAHPRATAIAIANGRILAIGSDTEVLARARPGTKRVDLGGMTVVPGFIDAHSHPASAGLSHLREVDCDLRSIPAIQQALRERAARTPAGQWVLGFKYDDTKTAEARFLTIADLDAVAPRSPGVRGAPGGPHGLRQHAGAQARGRHRPDTRPPGRAVRARRRRPAHRSRGRVRTGPVPPGHSRHVHPRRPAGGGQADLADAGEERDHLGPRRRGNHR